MATASPLWSVGSDETLRRLDATEHGLTSAEAEARLARHGPNELEEEQRVSRLRLLLHQFQSPLIFILLVATAVTLALREFVDAAVIAAVLLVNAAVGFSQESRAAQAIEALRRLARARARVVRDGRERELDARVLVPGDVLLVEAGARVAADCRILHAVALEVDESLLTGESTTVAKAAEPVPAGAALGDRASMLFTGTTVTRGHCRAVVAATGADTELGRIAGSMREVAEPPTPLQRRMDRFAHLVGIAVLAVSALGFVAGVAAGEDLSELFLAIVALAVAAIPEGLPIVMTLVLAVSVRRMARRRAIVRRLPAVETLGSCTVIGSDKTGTLTQNRMTVERILAGGEELHVTGGGYAVAGELRRDGRPVELEPGSPAHEALIAGALCNDASAVPAGEEFHVRGDPTEIALVVAAAKAGLYKDELEERLVRVAEIPFDPSTRFAVTCNIGEDGAVAFVKGAPEELLARCSDAAGRPLDREAIAQDAHRLAGEGLRVLATASRRLPDREAAHELAATGAVHDLEFLGLLGMRDPPRDDVPAAIARCEAAGIRVLMVTGDHAATAVAIARELGIPGAERGAVTGTELDALDDAALRGRVREISVFARVSPEHKLRIVQALQANGETVAVTGDGVNDAPALKAADIGAAMGASGTDVAKEASDMIVTDDSFTSIAAAVEEGRIAFDNIRKATFFLISSGAATILAVLASIAFRFQLPFFPAQLLWLNLVTNGIQDVALAFEPGEQDVLDRPPRPHREGIVSRLLWERTLIAGVVMAAGTVGLFLWELEATDDLGHARTVALTTMVLFQVVHVGNSRSEHRSAFAKSPFSNRFLFVGTVVSLAVHAAALYLPPTQYVLRVEPLDLGTWATMAVVSLSVLVAVELHKALREPNEQPSLRRSTMV